MLTRGHFYGIVLCLADARKARQLSLEQRKNMKKILSLVLVLFAFPALSAEPGIRSGHEKGYAVHEKASKDSITFQDKNKKNVLVLKGPAFAAWKRGTLGFCFLSEPVWAVRDSDGKLGKIYRFARGIVVEYGGKAYWMSWKMAEAWWSNSGVTRTDKK